MFTARLKPLMLHKCLNMDTRNLSVAVAVRRIKIIHFTVNERLIRDTNEKAVLDFGQQNQFTPQLNLFDYVLRVVYRYPDMPVGEGLATIEVNTTFEINNLPNYLDSENRILLSEPIWLSLTSMVIGHTRALFADRLAATVYRNFVIPIMDAKSLVDKFFPIAPQELQRENKEKAPT